MKAVLRVYILGMIGVLSVVGCGDDEDNTINFLTANPANHSTIKPDTTITAFFDGVPNNVTVNSEHIKTEDRMVIISGAFSPGPLKLKITWSDSPCVPNSRFSKLYYTVAEPQGDDSTDRKTDTTDKPQTGSGTQETDKDQ